MKNTKNENENKVATWCLLTLKDGEFTPSHQHEMTIAEADKLHMGIFTMSAIFSAVSKVSNGEPSLSHPLFDVDVKNIANYGKYYGVVTLQDRDICHCNLKFLDECKKEMLKTKGKLLKESRDTVKKAKETAGSDILSLALGAPFDKTIEILDGKIAENDKLLKALEEKMKSEKADDGSSKKGAKKKDA